MESAVLPRGRAGASRLVAAALGLMLTAGAACPGAAQPAQADLERFFGSYVGTAQVQDVTGGETRQRDMDIVIEPYEDDGFRLHWVNVSKVDGRRDVPGVERRVQTVLFRPADDQGYYLEVEEGNPFKEKEQTRPMQGDPVRWAAIDGERMHVYSFLVLEDGRYELQVYDRVLTDVGVDIDFQRIVNGQVLRRITGHTVRSDPRAPADEG